MTVRLIALFLLPALFWWGPILLVPFWLNLLDGKRYPNWSLVLVQLSIFVILATAYLQTPGEALLASLLPPVIAGYGLFQFAKVSLGSAPLLLAAVSGIATLYIAILVWRRNNPATARFALLPSLLLALAVFLTVGHLTTQRAMKQAADRLGGSCFHTRSLPGSFRIWGNDVQRDLHGQLLVAGQLHGWSFSENDFYPAPGTTHPHLHPCAEHPAD